jgi:hypothetical protein
MAKLDVATLLNDQLHEPDTASTSEAPETGTANLPESRTPAVPTSGDALGGPLHAHEVQSTEQQVPKYLRLDRKDTRLRTDQLDELGRLARRLQRARPQGSGERITENTLIRVGVDLVLALSDCLDGAGDEGELAARALARLNVGG